MGQLHNELRRTSLSEAIKRALGLTKSEGGIERFGETLTPTMDLWNRPEWAFLRGEQLWAFAQSIGPVVGEQAGAAVVNPARSGRIVTVTAGASAVLVAAGFSGVALTTEAVVTATYAQFAGGGLAMPNRDSRIAGVALSMPLPQFWTGSNPGSLITTDLRIDQGSSPTATLVPLTALPVVLSPGFALIVEAVTANQQILVNLSGAVRQALPGELV